MRTRWKLCPFSDQTLEGTNITSTVLDSQGCPTHIQGEGTQAPLLVGGVLVTLPGDLRDGRCTWECPSLEHSTCHVLGQGEGRVSGGAMFELSLKAWRK